MILIAKKKYQLMGRIWKAPYIFEKLESDPEDLIKFKCYNYDGWTF